ncbi:MAG: hypothetical protein AAB436_01200 [Patescibacteria group bacterium]
MSEELVPYNPDQPTTDNLPAVVGTEITRPMPTIHINVAHAEATTLADPNRIYIDPSRPISDQVTEDATNRGREKLTGLTWQEAGKTYEIADHDAFAARVTVVKKSRPKIQLKSHVKGGPTIARVTTHIPTYPDNERWTVKVTDADGQPADVISFEGSELAEYFNQPTDDGRPAHERLDSFIWNSPEPRKLQNTIQREPIDLGPKEPIFDSLVKAQEQAGTSSLVGIGWTLHGGSRQRISEDMTLMVDGDDGQKHPVRAWVLKTYGDTGDVIHQRIYKDHELQKYVNGMKNKKGDEILIKNPYRELGHVQPPFVAKIGSLASTGFVLHPNSERPDWIESEPTSEPDRRNLMLSQEEAEQMLSYGDINLDAEAVARVLAVLHGKKQIARHAEALIHIVEDVGKTTLLEVAENIDGQFMTALNKLNMQPKPEDISLSWILWELAEERYFAVHPQETRTMSAKDAAKDSKDKHDKKKKIKSIREFDEFGIKVGDPFDDDPVEAMRKQAEIVDNRLGLAFAESILIATEGKNHIVKDDKGHEGVVTLPDTYKIDVKKLEAMNLQEMILPELKEELYTITRDGEPLDRVHFVRLGKLLRRSFATAEAETVAFAV